MGYATRKKILEDGTPNPIYSKPVGWTERGTLPEKEVTVRPTKFKKSAFIAIDGEGVTTDEIIGYTDEGNPVYKHIYILLMASSGERLVDVNGLSTEACLNFFANLGRNYPNAIFVCFGASYDVNMILRDMPKEELYNLWSAKEKQKWDKEDNEEGFNEAHFIDSQKRRYTLSYRQRKQFDIRLWGNPLWVEKVTKHRDGTVTKKSIPNYEVSMTIWDVFGFFQSRYVDALGHKKNGYFKDKLVKLGNGDEYIVWSDGFKINLDEMKRMKKSRAAFTIEQIEKEIIPYCADEIEGLRRLMEYLRELLDDAGLKITRWDGAGACAGALYQAQGFKKCIQEVIPDPNVYHAQKCAYFGGRIELGQFGTYMGKIYNNDIISAYPAAMPLCPELTGGYWKQSRHSEIRNEYSMTYVKWKFDYGLPYYPFPFRDVGGTIYFPYFGEGWYWKPEADAALRAHASGKLPGTMELGATWNFYPCTDNKPLKFAKEKFELRALWKQQGKSAEKVLKLTINSLYGKLIQSLGGSEKNKPPYHNVGLGGYITSYTRARIYDAVMQAPENIIMIVTDGLYSTKQLDLDIGTELGQWEENELDGIVAVQAGVYWSLTELKREPTKVEQQDESFSENFLLKDGVWYKSNPHYRGFDKGTLNAALVLEAWQRYHEDGTPDKLAIPSTRFITMGSALASEKFFTFWHSWRTINRELTLLPTNSKREYFEQQPKKGRKAKRCKPHKELVRTNAVCLMLADVSQPYKLRWERTEPYTEVDGLDIEIVDKEVAQSVD